jgi:scyllo-inositol 2-dehydrogenase (NADP+)
MAAVDEIGVGIVGYGLAGRTFHAPFIATVDGLRVAAIATSDAGRQARARAEHPGAAVLASVDALLDQPDVELVVVASPNRSHAPIGTRALAAGRHVVVDKPVAMDVAEAEALVESAARAGRVLTVFQNRRWDGDFQTVRALIDGGRLGSLDSLEARFERWSAVGDEWREAADQAGGPHRDLGAHLVDQSLLLCGPASRVFAEIDRRRQGTAVEDSVFLAIDHASGVHSRIWTSLIAAHVGPRMRVRGTAGEYVKHALDVQEGQLLAGMRPDAEGFGVETAEQWGTLYGGDGGAEAIPTERGDYGRFYALLRDAIRGGGPPPVDPLDSIRALRVLEAAEHSARTGAAVPIGDGSA